jgi:hypothetical protein
MYFFDIDKFHFNCDGIYNGKQSWLSDDSDIKIIWDTTLTPNCWRFSSTTLYWLETVINTNPASPPINGNWNWVGRNYRIDANEGECAEVEELSMIITKTDPSCECNANLTVYGQGGQPPYMYSFDNGVTYVNSPFKNGLCGDLSLTVKIRDTLNNIASQLVQIPAQQPSTSYVVKIDPISTELIGGIQQTTSVVTITPPLPAGVTLNIGLKLTGRFSRTPFINSATGIYDHQVKKNGVLITSFTDNTIETTAQNTNPGCQGYLLYLRYYEYLYSNLQITASDTLEIKINTGAQLTCTNTPPAMILNGENELGPLGFGMSAASYVSCCSANVVSYLDATTLTLDGCDCCEVRGYTKSLYE